MSCKELSGAAAFETGLTQEWRDAALGYGEPALTAARAVNPAGRVVFQELSGEMLVVAREGFAQAGLDDVEVAFHAGDAEPDEVVRQVWQQVTEQA